MGVPKQLNLFVQNQLKDGVLKLDATQALRKTPALLGKTLDSSASHEAEINLPTDQSGDSLSQAKKEKAPEVQSSQAKKEQPQEKDRNAPARIEAREMPGGTWISEDDLLEHMGKCWRVFSLDDANPTVAELEMFMDIMAACDNRTCYPEDAMEFARTHIKPKEPRLWGALQSVRGFHKAICGEDVSTTNGLLAGPSRMRMTRPSQRTAPVG